MVMPSKSKKQQDFMAAVANNPKFAKKAGVPQSVGKDYEKADKMKKTKKFQAGGRMPVGMANPRAGVTGGMRQQELIDPETGLPPKEGGMPMGGVNPERVEMQTGSMPPRRINDPTPAQQRQAMRQARSSARRGGGGRKAGGKIGDKAMKFQAGGPMPVGMANPRAGVTGGKEMPMGGVNPERVEMQTGSMPPRRINDPTPAQQRQAMRQARSAARRGGGGRKAGGKIGAYKAGGKVRGAGCATKGTRAAKMVTMKGS
jgi:hypothetical protein